MPPDPSVSIKNSSKFRPPYSSITPLASSERRFFCVPRNRNPRRPPEQRWPANLLMSLRPAIPWRVCLHQKPTSASPGGIIFNPPAETVNRPAGLLFDRQNGEFSTDID